MKTLRMFGALLLTCVMCLNFVACDDDNENEPSPYFTADELVGIIWGGTNEAQDIYEIKIVNKTDLTLNIKSSEGTIYVDNETLKYQYNQEDGTFTSSYNEDQIKGQVTKTTMTFTVGDDEEQITLNKK